MDASYRVDQDALRKLGADLVSSAGDLDQAARRLGDPAIDDPVGVFGEYGAGAGFPAFRRAFLDEVGVHRDALAQTGRAIGAAANGYRDSDARAGDRLRG